MPTGHAPGMATRWTIRPSWGWLQSTGLSCEGSADAVVDDPRVDRRRGRCRSALASGSAGWRGARSRRGFPRARGRRTRLRRGGRVPLVSGEGSASGATTSGSIVGRARLRARRSCSPFLASTPKLVKSAVTPHHPRVERSVLVGAAHRRRALPAELDRRGVAAAGEQPRALVLEDEVIGGSRTAEIALTDGRGSRSGARLAAFLVRSEVPGTPRDRLDRVVRDVDARHRGFVVGTFGGGGTGVGIGVELPRQLPMRGGDLFVRGVPGHSQHVEMTHSAPPRSFAAVCHGRKGVSARAGASRPCQSWPYRPTSVDFHSFPSALPFGSRVRATR